MKKIPKSAFKRAFKLTSTGLSLLKDEIVKRPNSLQSNKNDEKTLKVRVEQVKKLTKTLNELKGSALKVGQLISMEAIDFFPKEVVEILSELQNNVTPLPHDEIIKVIENDYKSLGVKIHIPDRPFAAASIGQVYKTKYKNLDIILKVQYPGIEESIDSDISLLSKLIKSVLLVFDKSFPVDIILDEIRTLLYYEVDYENELKNNQKYLQLVENTPELNIIVPRPILELSTPKILAQEFIHGITIREWIKLNPSTENKLDLAKQFINLFCHEFFQWKFIQSDPNLGNFLITNEHKLVTLDFGACIEYDDQFVDNYKQLIRSLTKDRNSIIQESIKFNILDSRESDETQGLFVEMMEYSIMPLIRNQEFDFSNTEYSDNLRKLVLNFMKKCQYPPAPRNLLFLNRKLGGLFQTLRLLEVKINLYPIIEKWYFDDVE